MTGREMFAETVMEMMGISKEAALELINNAPPGLLPPNIDRDLGTREEVDAKMAAMIMTPEAQARFDEMFGAGAAATELSKLARKKRPPAGS